MMKVTQLLVCWRGCFNNIFLDIKNKMVLKLNDFYITCAFFTLEFPGTENFVVNFIIINCDKHSIETKGDATL